MNLTTVYNSSRVTVEVYTKADKTFELKAHALVEGVMPWEIETELRYAQQQFIMDELKKKSKRYNWIWWPIYGLIWYSFGWVWLLVTALVQALIAVTTVAYVSYKGQQQKVTYTINPLIKEN